MGCDNSKSAFYDPSPLAGEGQDGGGTSHVSKPELKSTLLSPEVGRPVKPRGSLGNASLWWINMELRAGEPFFALGLVKSVR